MQLEWTPDPNYTSGVDHCVLYPEGGPGAVWNGIRSVQKSDLSTGNEPIYLDGIKLRNHVGNRNFRGEIEAYTAPLDFAPCIGHREIAAGILLTRQRRSRFGLTYRTRIAGGPHYKIHILYNVTASQTRVSYDTLAESSEPTIFAWSIDAVPTQMEGFRPSSYYELDSRKINPDSLIEIEKTLYGTSTEDSRLLDVLELNLYLNNVPI